jgi:hypothetical protein
MRTIIGTNAATLAVAAAVATSATPASAGCQGPGWYNCDPPKSISTLPALGTRQGGEVVSVD